MNCCMYVCIELVLCPISKLSTLFWKVIFEANRLRSSKMTLNLSDFMQQGLKMIAAFEWFALMFLQNTQIWKTNCPKQLLPLIQFSSKTRRWLGQSRLYFNTSLHWTISWFFLIHLLLLINYCLLFLKMLYLSFSICLGLSNALVLYVLNSFV